MSPTVSYPGRPDVQLGAGGDCITEFDCTGVHDRCVDNVCTVTGTSACDCSNPNLLDVQCTSYCAFIGSNSGGDSGSFWDWITKNTPTILPIVCRLLGSGCPAFFPGTTIPLVAPPWYTTPAGIGLAIFGIGVLGLGFYYVAK